MRTHNETWWATANTFLINLLIIFSIFDELFGLETSLKGGQMFFSTTKDDPFTVMAEIFTFKG